MAEEFHSQEVLRGNQLAALNELLGRIIPANPFYTQKALDASITNSFHDLDEFAKAFPFTTKQEIVRDQEKHPRYGQNLTFPLEAYTRLHQTSGTTGKPLRWLDTAETWEVLLDCWVEVYKAAGVTKKDIAFFAFSFGPFLGFWTAFEAAAKVGCLVVPGGALTTLGRLQLILDTKATVLCCTPTYAIHMAQAAAAERIDLSKSSVRLIIVAGEPGGSVPGTRSYLEGLWPGARVFDHHGMTEVGPVTYECPKVPNRLHVVDWAYYAEILDSESGSPVPVGTVGELVLTTLKRVGSPLLRYRTGDLVKLAEHHKDGKPCVCGKFETALEGGILGRTDDMVVVRGVNIYPTAIEQIIRQFPNIVEYQVNVARAGALTEMHVQVEPDRTTRSPAQLVAEVEKALQTALSLRIPVTAVPPGELPRAELKARRWIKKG